MGVKPKLTIGMAQFQDFDGVFFTIQALRMYHAEVMQGVELIVVDNSPGGPGSNEIQGVLSNAANSGLVAGVKYIPMSSPQGTSPSRDRIFAEATGDAVLAIDCHILIEPGGIARLLKYYGDGHDQGNILSGPLWMDSLGMNLVTHYDDQWRGGMWGIWGAAWKCQCGEDGSMFSMREVGPNAFPHELKMDAKPINSCTACRKLIPRAMPWAGHEAVIFKEGFRPVGFDSDTPPFEIPGMGLGLFSCRRDAWLGFHPLSREFGGEELYIHEKFRKAGRRAICLPFLKWNHRFFRVGGLKYAASAWGKIRNYVLEFMELGRDLEPIRKHFVENYTEAGGSQFTQQQWDKLLQDPIKYEREEMCPTCGGKKPVEITSIEDSYRLILGIPRDLDQHMPKIMELASTVERVTEISGRRESTIAILAGKPKRFVSFNSEMDSDVSKAIAVSTTVEFTYHNLKDGDPSEIEETDFLFLDHLSAADPLYGMLNALLPKVSRYVAIHDTQIFGENAGGGPGILPALRRYLKENPEWSVVYHTQNQYGLTVISRDERDKPKLPGLIEMGINFAKALKEHVADGLKTVDSEILNQRLETCTLCDQHTDGRCAVCGCFLSEKTKWRISSCPLGKWMNVGDIQVVGEESK